MKKTVFGVVLFSAAVIAADIVIIWDTAPARAATPKYHLGEQKSLGVFPSGPVALGPKLWNIECISESEKDCVQVNDPVAHPIPEPSTLALIGLGLAGLFWRKR